MAVAGLLFSVVLRTLCPSRIFASNCLVTYMTSGLLVVLSFNGKFSNYLDVILRRVNGSESMGPL